MFSVMNMMVLILIAIVVGVLAVAILIIKTTKTPPQDIVGMNITCKKCGTQTNGLACPKCKNKSQSFGVWRVNESIKSKPAKLKKTEFVGSLLNIICS